MDRRLKSILQLLLSNIDMLNAELLRLERSDLFHDSEQCLQLIEQARGSCTGSLQNLRTIERRLYARDLTPPIE